MKLIHALKLALLLVALACTGAARAEALPVSAVPQPLKPWVPWVMHGHEMLACPATHNGDDTRACVWPSRLELQATKDGAAFRLEVQVFGAPAAVDLPGEPGRWPHDLRADGKPAAATRREGRPVTQLAPGSHVVTGVLRWPEMPQDILLPKETGSLQLSLNGKPVQRTPDADGRIWLQQSQTQAQASDALTVRVSRLVDDGIPLRVTTHYEISVAGKPREILLPAALLPGFVPESLNSPLPARLQEPGQLRLQSRPGNWTVSISGRLMSPVNALSLPADQPDEIWSFVAHNELRLVTVEGLTSVDPKQVPLPDAWRGYPAYQVKAGQTLKLVESRRGNPQPGADRLTLARHIWLDFDGGGYTMKDAINGTLSRSWRLEMAAPGVLGRAAANGSDQPVTRRADAKGDGVELRHGAVVLNADSRVESNARRLPATGWQADFNAASGQLHLPPGWRLLHAAGVDKADGSWVSRWTLWDFFFVLLGVLATGKLLGRKAAALMAGALVLTWHMPGAPHAVWLLLIGLLALTRAPQGKLQNAAVWGSRACAALIALWLLPYAVDQVRLSLYPSLEHPWMQLSDAQATGSMEHGRPPAALPAATPTPLAKEEAETPASLAKSGSLASPTVDASRYRSESKKVDEIDPSVKVNTGPGLPGWQWNSHQLVWQGPVQAGQNLDLVLLPPAGTVVLRLGGLALMIAALWALCAGLTGWRLRFTARAQGTAAALLAGLLVAGLGGMPDDAHATTTTPDTATLDALRDKLTAAPACRPQCADIARLHVEAQGSRVQLRLEVHALSDVMLPLPGQGTNWRPTLISTDGMPAVVRRDANGALWTVARTGVSQVLLAADVGDSTNVEIALPMPPRDVSAQAPGWTLGGLDARGLASGALSLSRNATGSKSSDGGTQRDALPPFVQVERILHLGLRWTVETRVSRLAPSRAPVRVKIPLLDGEAVNSEVVRIEDGHAVVQLGAEDATTFTSSLKEATKLQLKSAHEANQVELWRLDPSVQWHVGWSGIAPVHYVDRESGRLMPAWQPWPGETIALAISKPAGTPGQTLTVDRLRFSVSPGLRATDVSSTATLRSSQGSNHRMQLPEGVEFLGVSVDGQSQPIQPQGRDLLIPILPGAHTVQIDWREPRGMGWWFETQPHGVGAAGVNATTQIKLPPERVVLAVGGPRVGPAVLFWGVLAMLAAVAVVLGRSKMTPLGVLAWFLLGLGLAQVSLAGAAIVAGWFFVLALRGRMVPDNAGTGMRWGGWSWKALQVVLVLWTLVCAVILLDALRVGLLGYPDMMIVGNGSNASVLQWYQDRFADHMATTWVVSVPVLAYRLVMLLWAFWLAASMLKWVTWAWQSFSAGGYWYRSDKHASA